MGFVFSPTWVVSAVCTIIIAICVAFERLLHCTGKKMISLLHLLCIASLVAAQLNHEEVETLKEISQGLGKSGWDFNIDPCGGKGNWSLESPLVTCDCSANVSSCYIVGMTLESQNLSGIVPSGFSKLHYLRYLDLSRNNLRGSIPPQWASMRLLNLSFMGNRLSGPFPTVLTRITSLVSLDVEGNLFTGSIPPEIGQLINLRNLILSSNLFTGELPDELANLTNITDIKISDNNLTGKIPDFIGMWRQIETLHIQGSSLEGPIPSNISFLTSLSDLRISDLNGRGSSFPPIQNLTLLQTLILRRCSIFGVIPDYIGNMTDIDILDLSYNNLTGNIPKTFEQLSATIEFMYLTGNKLTGPIPRWIIPSKTNIDLSNNNFTWEGLPLACPQGNVNLVESLTSTTTITSSRMDACLVQNFPCKEDQQHYSLHINCGGSETYVEHGVKYEADLEVRGASTYYQGKNWAFSSTGNFIDNDLDAYNYDYIRTNTSALRDERNDDMLLYETARASPLSLTYYGVCMMNGNYTVGLHFIEIIFADDGSFSDPGKRSFDVYLQEMLVLKDFNIQDEAGGSGIALVKNFTVVITSNTLKIHLYWAGKGTTGIPVRGSYGPLISAISVDPNFTPPSVHGETVGIIGVIGIVLVAILIILLILCILRKRGVLGSRTSADTELRRLHRLTDIFSLDQIKAATRDFDAANKIGEGGFGSVYKGTLPDGNIIAVKQLSSTSRQGNHEFVTEVGMISGLQHPNLVKLHGCCIDGNQLLLIYEYMENNSVSRVLFGRDSDSNIKLDWPTRRKICLGVARGLAYLHDESILKMVHRDIKPSNILLDKDLNAKISDFGLAKLYEEGCTHISTRVGGTIGYMAPEYAMYGHLTAKADVYSFGVVVLEIVSGKRNTNFRPTEEFVTLSDWAYALQERGSLLELVDPDLGSEYVTEEVIVMLNVALLCTKKSSTRRPTMSQVVCMVEGSTDVPDLSDPSSSTPVGNNTRQHPAHSLSHSNFSDGSSDNLLSTIDEVDDEMAIHIENTF